MTIGGDHRVRLGATVYATPAALAADPGPTSTPRYAYVVSLDRHFSWNLYSTDTTNNVTIIGTNGNGAVGVWRAVTGDTSGAVLAGTTPQTLTVAGGRLRVIPLGALVANLTLNLSTTGAQTDDEIEIVCNDTAAFTVTVVNGGVGAGNIAVKPVRARGWIRAKFDGTNWSHAGSSLAIDSATTIYQVSQTFLYTDLTDSTTSKTINLFGVLPTGAIPLTRQITLTTPFVAVGLSRLELTIGVAGGQEIMTPFRCEQAAQVVKGTDGNNPQGVYGGQQLTAKFTPTGALLSALTAGSVTVLTTYFVPISI